MTVPEPPSPSFAQVLRARGLIARLAALGSEYDDLAGYAREYLERPPLGPSKDTAHDEFLLRQELQVAVAVLDAYLARPLPRELGDEASEWLRSAVGMASTPKTPPKTSM